jgi:hypothetical protein
MADEYKNMGDVYTKMAEIVAGLKIPAEDQKRMFKELRAVADKYDPFKPAGEERLSVEDLLESGSVAKPSKPQSPLSDRTYPKGTRYAVINPKDIL